MMTLKHACLPEQMGAGGIPSLIITLSTPFRFEMNAAIAAFRSASASGSRVQPHGSNQPRALGSSRADLIPTSRAKNPEKQKTDYANNSPDSGKVWRRVVI